MDNFLKIAIFLLLSTLTVTFALLHDAGSNDIFPFLSIICLMVLLGIYLSYFADDIAKLLKALNETKTKKSLPIKMESTSSFAREVSWDKFVENNPIPSILFDEHLKLVKRNKAFKDLLVKRGLSLESRNIQDNFVCNVNDFISFMADNERKSLVGEAILNDANKTPFTFFSVPVADINNTHIYLAQFIDNSENIGLKEKFIQAQKMQAIGQLAGGVAHDFNNLLTAIIGFCDLLLTRHAAGDSSFVDIMHIKQNANRAASLVKQLLAFSRKQTMQMEAVQIGNVLSEISNLLRRLIGENINLNFHVEHDSWDIRADKSQLEQVLINLAINARDAIVAKNSGGGMLEIKCRNKEIISAPDIKFKYNNHVGFVDITPGKYVMISITDNGTGIPPENLKKIFEPFFTTKQIGHGTGLGLATVTGIIEQTGGYIFVSSEKGAGTEFLIFIKRYEKTAEDIAQENIVKEKAKDLTGQGTVLIVEDEEPVRIFSSRALKNKGYNVLEAFSGENALEVVEENKGNIDLIISDVVMPGINGPEMVAQVLKKYPNIKVVFVSGYGEDAFYGQYGAERKFNFLPKPYTLNQLAERVKDILES